MEGLDSIAEWERCERRKELGAPIVMGCIRDWRMRFRMTAKPSRDYPEHEYDCCVSIDDEGRTRCKFALNFASP